MDSLDSTAFLLLNSQAATKKPTMWQQTIAFFNLQKQRSELDDRVAKSRPTKSKYNEALQIGMKMK